MTDAHSLAAHNAAQREQATKALARLIDDALSRGNINAVAIRVPINRGKLGNVREILERDAG